MTSNAFFLLNSYVSPYINQNTPAYKKFEEYYTMRFEKPGFYSAHAYDATMSLLMAIKKSGSTDPSKIKEELRKLNYQGASKRINFNDNGDTGSNYTVFGIHSGEFHPYLFGKAPYKCACDVSDECDAECSCDCDCPDNCE